MERRNSKKYRTVKITDAFQSVKPRKKLQPVKKVVKQDAVLLPSSSNIDEHLRKEELNRLRQFDMAWEFGPCIGITRLERWERAEKLGLQPPIDVKNVILNHSEDESYSQCVWSYYKVL